MKLSEIRMWTLHWLIIQEKDTPPSLFHYNIKKTHLFYNSEFLLYFNWKTPCKLSADLFFIIKISFLWSYCKIKDLIAQVQNKLRGFEIRSPKLFREFGKAEVCVSYLKSVIWGFQKQMFMKKKKIIQLY